MLRSDTDRKDKKDEKDRKDRKNRMDRMGTERKHQLPKIGLRNIKTAVSASLCALIYFFIGRNPTFACIGAVFGMGTDMEHSKLHGGNRLFGTIIGGVVGMALFSLYIQLCSNKVNGEKGFLLIPLLFVGIVILILLAQIFWVGAVQPGSVMLCIILFNTPMEDYISYSFNRILDTAVGVLMSLLINYLLPQERLEQWGAMWTLRKSQKSGKEIQNETNDETKK